MKKLLFLIALLAFGSFYSTSYAQRVRISCPTTLNDINDCPDTGWCNVDPHLNRQKNIRSLAGEAEPMTIQQMRNLPDPVKGFKVGNTREKIEALGEGKKIVVVANAIAVRKGSKESCNCGLSTVANTDNHLVLVDRVLRIKPAGFGFAETISDEEAQDFMRIAEVGHLHVWRQALIECEFLRCSAIVLAELGNVARQALESGAPALTVSLLPVSVTVDARGVCDVGRLRLAEAIDGADLTRVRECNICGKLFWAGRKDKNFCRDSCGNKLRKSRSPKYELNRKVKDAERSGLTRTSNRSR